MVTTIHAVRVVLVAWAAQEVHAKVGASAWIVIAATPVHWQPESGRVSAEAAAETVPLERPGRLGLPELLVALAFVPALLLPVLVHVPELVLRPGQVLVLVLVPALVRPVPALVLLPALGSAPLQLFSVEAPVTGLVFGFRGLVHVLSIPTPFPHPLLLQPHVLLGCLWTHALQSESGSFSQVSVSSLERPCCWDFGAAHEMGEMLMMGFVFWHGLLPHLSCGHSCPFHHLRHHYHHHSQYHAHGVIWLFEVKQNELGVVVRLACEFAPPAFWMLMESHCDAGRTGFFPSSF